MNLTNFSGHGALFQLSQLAYYQLLHRAGGKPVKGVGLSRYVYFFNEKDDAPAPGQPALNKIHSRLRYVDIVLGERSFNEPEEWIELKSYEAQSAGRDAKRFQTVEEIKRGVNGKFTRWEFKNNNKGSGMHKQFSIDRAAHQIKLAWIPVGQAGGQGAPSVQQEISDYSWRFQKFKTTDRRTKDVHTSIFLGDSTKNPSVRWLFQEGPTNVDKDVYSENFGPDSSTIPRKAVLVSGFSLVRDLAKLGLSDVVENVVEEVVDEE